jgi:hypothetical protein
MKIQLSKTIVLVTIFSIAMALLESAVVTYLRELYYPHGFSVAFKEMPQKIIVIEMFREFATLIMLISIGWFAGQNIKTRFAWFLYSFAIWDIFYYVWLKLFVNWPVNIFEWDILFLLPVTWLAPVLAPVICSITMILLSILIIKNNSMPKHFVLNKYSWLLIISGALIIYASFTKDYTSIIIKHGFYRDFGNILHNSEFLNIAKSYIPESFSWGWFWIGEILILTGSLKYLLYK